MEIRNRNGVFIKPGVLADDVLKDHLSTQEIFEKRQLEFETREEFLDCLEQMLKNNKKLYNSIKKCLYKNDLQKEKKAKKYNSKNSKTNSPNGFEEITVLENHRSRIIDDLSKKKAELEQAEANLNNAKKVVEAAQNKLDECMRKLREIEEKIEIAKNKIYLVAPGYVGDIPEYGIFYSISTVDKITNIQVVEVGTESLRPDFEEMIKSGYDSAQEYITGLKFVMLCEEFIYAEKEYCILNLDERINRLLAIHIGIF